MVEEEKLGKAPEQEIKVWGLGLTNNKLDQIIKLIDRQNFLASMIEKKLDKIIEKDTTNK